MSNQIIDLLQRWHEHKDSTEWVLGCIYKTEGPCYRKTGAMMLFGGDGQQLGMLSGGCLESDIQKHARRVMHCGKSMTISYDGTDEDDMSFQLGIGCGGSIDIVLTPLTAQNQYQHLDKVYQSLCQRQRCGYLVEIPQGGFAATSNRFESDTVDGKPQLILANNRQVLSVVLNPNPHLLVAGGGIDARPLVAMAAQLGWQVSLWDPRPANARREYFLTVEHILQGDTAVLAKHCLKHSVDAVVLMSHNLSLDAQVLSALTGLPTQHLKYLALLGPKNRRKDVLKLAGLAESDMPKAGLSGPAGLDIGGELPESIALSILSECHARLHHKPCSVKTEEKPTIEQSQSTDLNG